MQNFSTPLLVVAAALVKNDGRVLMQKRRAESVHGGLWEFPGGKIEAQESPNSAVARELREELGIDVAEQDIAPLAFASGLTAGDQAARPLVILLYTCRNWSGEPQCLIADRIEWFAVNSLNTLGMPPLDYPLAGSLLGAMRNNRL